MSTEEELAKRARLTKLANSHGYSDLESLYKAMDYEKNAALARIKLGLIPNGRARLATKTTP